MIDPRAHELACLVELGLAVVTCVALLFIVAPYGRHTRPGWGPTVPDRVGWVLMELPTLAAFVPLYLFGPARASVAPLVFLGLWLAHYVHRTLIYPFRLRSRGKRIPALIVALGMAFNCLNAFVIAPQLSTFGHYPLATLLGAPFLLGTCLFVLGYVINRHADHTLISLRAPGESGYRIPRGGLFEYVSCPNYLGEIVQWLGFAVATWSFAGLTFALYTAANVGPRALSHHRFYQRSFADYPKSRKAVIPFLL